MLDESRDEGSAQEDVRSNQSFKPPVAVSRDKGMDYAEQSVKGQPAFKAEQQTFKTMMTVNQRNQLPSD